LFTETAHDLDTHTRLAINIFFLRDLKHRNRFFSKQQVNKCHSNFFSFIFVVLFIFFMMAQIVIDTYCLYSITVVMNNALVANSFQISRFSRILFAFILEVIQTIQFTEKQMVYVRPQPLPIYIYITNGVLYWS